MDTLVTYEQLSGVDISIMINRNTNESYKSTLDLETKHFFLELNSLRNIKEICFFTSCALFFLCKTKIEMVVVCLFCFHFFH